ncbi:DUF378 domain-containing protein [Oceanobacillus senegalensis]|uniref:DUF378 domain-containing protein n=1 Tax=Oceanobacillus senegalensis TaxID=1936063 RepID=UPI000A30CFAB|nr:DUF378 domain-containing protein [Oceanobacillus senegalensis]
MSTLKRIALTLLIIGGINWGLIGLFQFDLVASLFGGQDAGLSRVVYTLVGISSLYCLTLLFDTRDDTVQTGRLNYGTEFGEEFDTPNERRDDFDKK